MSVRVAFITGINGQDGSYLSELLLEKGYYVYGIIRRMSCINTVRIDNLKPHPRFQIMYGDMCDSISLQKVLYDIVKAHDNNLEVLEIYNLAAQSHVKISFEMPEYTCDVNAMGTLRLLEIARNLPISMSKIKFYQASTSELYGDNENAPQNEETLFRPVSPYSIAKQFAYNMVIMYRKAYGMYTCNGILFNHESSRRGENFLTRKVVICAKKIADGQMEYMEVGNLDSARDWGHAKDYVEGMWRIMQHETPDDFVLGTGRMTSVREFIERVFFKLGIVLVWNGVGTEETGTDKNTGKVVIRVNPRYYRPVEVSTLCADYKKAHDLLGWKPKYDLNALIDEMLENGTI